MAAIQHKPSGKSPEGGHVFRYYGMYRERELRASQLETGLAHARLEALRMQLHPHFLFNTLNSISTLMHRDVEAADDLLSALSDLLRVALDRRKVEVRSRREGDRLTLTVQDDGPGIPAVGAIVEGVGLSNTADRLKQLYGEQQSLRIDSPPG